MTPITTRGTFVALLTLLAIPLACGTRQHVETAASPTPLARFVVEGPPPVPHVERGSSARSDPGSCTVTGRFEGAAHARGDGQQLEVAIERGWAIITRNNDKQWDDLHLRLQASAPIGSGSATLVLGPTVDSAGPSVTTWQSSEPFRVLVPWARGLTTRRLMFWLSYRAVGFDGRVTRCEMMMRSDTLRFAPASTG